MRISDVFIIEEAFDDLNQGKDFYDFQEKGVGDYFWDCLISDIESLIIYAGIHKKILAEPLPISFRCSTLRTPAT